MIIEQAILPIECKSLKTISSKIVATVGVTDAEIAFVRQLLAEGARESSPCRIIICPVPTDRYLIVYQTSGDAEVCVFFFSEVVFAEFDYQPFRLLDYALARRSNSTLEPLEVADVQELHRGSVRSSMEEIDTATSRWTVGVLCGLLDCLLTDGQLGVLVEQDARDLVSSLYELLPISCRRELSLNGLTSSFSAYPFQLCVAPDTGDTWTALLQSPGVSVVSLDDTAEMTTELRHPWANVVQRILDRSGAAACHDFVRSAPPSTTFASLKRLANISLAGNDDVGCSRSADVSSTVAAKSGFGDPTDSRQTYQGHALQGEISDNQQATIPKLDLAHRETLERLDQLDDAIFEAIDGSDQGFSRLETLWPQAKANLASELIEESRDQYVRLIVDQCDRQLQTVGNVDQSTAKLAMDVLRLLFSNASN